LEKSWELVNFNQKNKYLTISLPRVRAKERPVVMSRYFHAYSINETGDVPFIGERKHLAAVSEATKERSSEDAVPNDVSTPFKAFVRSNNNFNFATEFLNISRVLRM